MKQPRKFFGTVFEYCTVCQSTCEGWHPKCYGEMKTWAGGESFDAWFFATK